MNVVIFSIGMAYDAFRICIGHPTKNHPPADVIRWMQMMLAADNTETGS